MQTDMGQINCNFFYVYYCSYVMCLFSQLVTSPIVQLHHLIIIGWKDEQGEIQEYYLTDKISHKWRDIGSFNGLSLSELATISELFPNDPKECCQAVLGQWLDNPPTDYPTTWQGLLQLLKDSQLDQTASESRSLVYKSPEHTQFKQEYKEEIVATNTKPDLVQHNGKIIIIIIMISHLRLLHILHVLYRCLGFA